MILSALLSSSSPGRERLELRSWQALRIPLLRLLLLNGSETCKTAGATSGTSAA